MTRNQPAEHILCSSTDSLPALWLPATGAVPLTEETLLRTLSSLAPEWRLRSDAEQDPRFKQWIPYVLLQDPEGRLAAYPRRGSEHRLHGLWSFGIGGHVNPVDAPERFDAGHGSQYWRTALTCGLRRELAEELPSARPVSTRLLGLVHESTTAVGQVHLGVVFLCRLGDVPTDAGTELEGLRWIAPPCLGSGEWPLDRFELWSRLALQLLP